MRVGLEGSFWAQPTTGSGQYVRALWREFAHERFAGRLQPVLLRPAPAADSADEPPGEVVTETAPTWCTGKLHKLWWEQVGLPRAARRAGVDLVHVPYFAALPRPDRPYVETIHDLVPLVMPIYATTGQMRLYLRLARATARRATLILTDSQHSAGDIADHLALPPSKLRVIPLAADEGCRPLPPDDPAPAAARARYGIPGPFIFNVGGLDVRKNLAVLIQAYALARPQLPPETRLVISGAAHSGHPEVYPELEPVAATYGVADGVIFTGRISDDEKVALLNAATVYVYPSLYEGFGLSPLEAMRCGTPTISSNRSSLPEVVGEGGLLLDPTPEKLAGAIAFMLGTPHECQSWRRRALEQAATFSWARTAEATVAAYQEALGQDGPAWAARAASDVDQHRAVVR